MIAKTRPIQGVGSTVSLPTLRYLEPEYVYMAVTNARCATSDIYVKVGDEVKIGQKLGIRKGPFFEQPIHATVSGEVVGFVKKFHRSGKLTEFIQIKNNFKDEWISPEVPRSDEEIDKLTLEDYANITKECSLVGLGGSSFPTYIKFQTKDPIHTILINGVECEPYISSDHRIILEHAKRVILGTSYAMKPFKAKKALICIKKNIKIYMIV